MMNSEQVSIIYTDTLMNKQKNPLICYIANGGILKNCTMHFVCAVPYAFEALICYIYRGNDLTTETLLEIVKTFDDEKAEALLTLFIKQQKRNLSFSKELWDAISEKPYCNNIVSEYYRAGCLLSVQFSLLTEHEEAEEILNDLIDQDAFLPKELLYLVIQKPYGERVLGRYIDKGVHRLEEKTLLFLLGQEYGCDLITRYCNGKYPLPHKVLDKVVELPDEQAKKILLSCIKTERLVTGANIFAKPYAKEVLLAYIEKWGYLPVMFHIYTLPYDYAEDILEALIKYDETNDYFCYRQTLAVIKKPSFFNWVKLFCSSGSYFTPLRYFLKKRKKKQKS